MSCIDAPQVVYMGANETLNAGVSFASRLRTGETMTGSTPTVTISPTGPTLSNKAVNTTTQELNGATVAVGEAVMFTITGGGADAGVYKITVTCATDASPPATLVGNLKLVVE